MCHSSSYRDETECRIIFVFPEQQFLSKLLVMSSALRLHLLSWNGATKSPIPLYQRVLQHPSPSLGPFITLKMPLSLAELISTRSKEDWFVCVQRDSEKEKTEVGAEIDRCQAVSDKHIDSPAVSVCMCACAQLQPPDVLTSSGVHSASAHVYLSNAAYLNSPAQCD